jgi:ElaB/YqjD/DUF883 family membrane-anchored ribosome-binding protein
MNDELDRLFAQIHAIEGQIERRLDANRANFKFRLAKGRAVFDASVAQAHRRLRTGALRYVIEAPWRNIAVAPVIYAMVVPFALLDLSLTLYQWICFSAWGISRVPRGPYIVIDRHRLAYLNAIEKLNCVYCGYGNGVIAYARDIAGRTEQYWCPIRHATQLRAAHDRYKDFVDYGDAEGYRARLEALRAKLR